MRGTLILLVAMSVGLTACGGLFDQTRDLRTIPTSSTGGTSTESASGSASTAATTTTTTTTTEPETVYESYDAYDGSFTVQLPERNLVVDPALRRPGIPLDGLSDEAADYITDITKQILTGTPKTLLAAWDVENAQDDLTPVVFIYTITDVGSVSIEGLVRGIEVDFRDLDIVLKDIETKDAGDRKIAFGKGTYVEAYGATMVLIGGIAVIDDTAYVALYQGAAPAPQGNMNELKTLLLSLEPRP